MKLILRRQIWGLFIILLFLAPIILMAKEKEKENEILRQSIAAGTNVLSPLTNQKVKEKEQLDISLSAKIVSGHAVRFYAKNLPDFAELIDYRDGSGFIRLQTARGDSGTYEKITVYARVVDELTPIDSTQFTIFVNPAAPELSCEVVITSPLDRQQICAETASVTGTISIANGVAPYDETVWVNNISAQHDSNTFSATAPLLPGLNLIGVYYSVEDANGDIAHAADTVWVERCESLQGSVTILNPEDLAYVCDDSADIMAVSTFSGGVAPITTECYINGMPVNVESDTIRARVPLLGSLSIIGVTCMFIDAIDNETSASDIVRINKCDPFTSTTHIISPQSGEMVCSDQIEVTATVDLQGGLGPYYADCYINGVAASYHNGVVSAIVPILGDTTLIGVFCSFTDVLGNITQSADTISVVSCPPLDAQITIIEPIRGEPACGDSVTVTAVHSIAGGLAPYDIECTVNGQSVVAIGDTIRTRIALLEQATFIGVHCSVNDATGEIAQAADTLTVERCADLDGHIDIVWPIDSDIICEDSIWVVVQTDVSNNRGDVVTDCAINGVTAFKLGDFLMAKIPLPGATNLIAAYCVFTDSAGRQSYATDVIQVSRCYDFSADFTVLSPRSGEFICSDSVTITAIAQFDGGQPPITKNVTINGQPFPFTGDTLRARLPLDQEANFFGVHAVFNDAQGFVTQSADTLTVFRCDEQPLFSSTQIVFPQRHAQVCSDSIIVIALNTVTGGEGSITRSATVNNSPALMRGDSIFATIPIIPGANFVGVFTSVKDASGQIANSADTLTFLGCDTSSFSGLVDILTPESGQLICEENVLLTAIAVYAGGIEPVDLTATINGQQAEIRGDTISAMLPMTSGVNFFGVRCVFTDAAGNITQAADTVTVFSCDDGVLRSSVTFLEPQSGDELCTDSVDVVALVRVRGGTAPITAECTLNGQPVSPQGDTLRTRVALQEGPNFLGLYCTFEDAIGQITQSADTLTVFRCADIFSAQVRLLTPTSGQILCVDSVFVQAIATSSGGVEPVLQEARISGRTPIVRGDTLTSWIHLSEGPNLIGVFSKFTDAEGNTTQAADTATVFYQAFSAQIAILSPADSAMICHSDSVEITGFTKIIGAQGAVTLRYNVNGRRFTAAPGAFSINLAPPTGIVPIIASVTATDSAGCTATAIDSIHVIYDATPPEVYFDFENMPVISGKLWDNETGIAWVELVNVENRVVTFEDFEPGKQEIAFTSDILDPHQPSSFTFRAANMAGCIEEYDPIYLKLDGSSGINYYTFSLPPQDRYMRVDNQGIEHIELMINGRPIHLVSENSHAPEAETIYVMPAYGQLAIDIFEYLDADSTDFELSYSGPRNATADFLIADREVAKVITKIEEGHVPDALRIRSFKLSQNYPNPFNAHTIIQFALPENAHVQLTIYNILGQRVFSKDLGMIMPGEHRMTWYGSNENGETVASGVYIYRLEAANPHGKHWHDTKKMNLVK